MKKLSLFNAERPSHQVYYSSSGSFGLVGSQFAGSGHISQGQMKHHGGERIVHKSKPLALQLK